jgi:hypothetical protein
VIFGCKYGGITGMEYAYVFHLFDRVAVGSTVMDIVVIILFFLNSKRVGLFSESMDLPTEQELVIYYSAIIIIIIINSIYARQ